MGSKEKLIYKLFDKYFEGGNCDSSNKCHPIVYEQKRIIQSDMSWEEKQIRFVECTNVNYRKEKGIYYFNYDEYEIVLKIAKITEEHAIDELISGISFYIANNESQEEYFRKLTERKI